MIFIKKYNHKLLYIWDAFIEKSNNATLFHKQSFLNYHLQRQFEDSSLLFYSNKTLCGVLPAAIIKQKKQKVLCSHPGASYGGLIIGTNIAFKIIDQLIIQLDKYCVENKLNSIVLTQTPLCYYKNLNHSLEYLFFWNKYKIY